MHPALSSILRLSTKKNEEKLNILTFSTHERYQSNMADINANFWLIDTENTKKWNYKYAEIPKNHHLLNDINEIKDIPLYIEFDAVLSQNRFFQFHSAKKMAEYLNIPLICLEHTEMIDGRQKFKKFKGDLNIFISEFSAKSWEPDYDYHIIEHGINTSVFHNKNFKKEQNVLSVVNNWIERDNECGFYFWKEITENFKTKVIGNTPNLSMPAKNVNDLVNFYNRSAVFLNTSIKSPLPMTLLEAMSCGCCVVSTENEMISKVIKNEENGFISNDKNKLINYINMCLNDKNLNYEIGKKARETILNNYSLEKFTNSWNNILNSTLRK